MSPLGVALVGPGRAGRARIAALAERADAELRAVVERAGPLRLEDALADPAIDAVLICTPNALHAAQVRAALERGKHVCVEYPLAASAAQARSLLALARERERVLHVEHIELLSPAQEHQRERARGLGPPAGGALEFSGGFTGWIADPALAGSPALGALARLHRLTDLFGPARIRAAELAQRGAGYRLRADLEFARGGATELREERGPDLSRALRWNIPCARGALLDPPAAPVQGLFARDLACFLARVRERAPSYVCDEDVLHGLELVEQIERVLADRNGC